MVIIHNKTLASITFLATAFSSVSFRHLERSRMKVFGSTRQKSNSHLHPLAQVCVVQRVAHQKVYVVLSDTNMQQRMSRCLDGSRVRAQSSPVFPSQNGLGFQDGTHTKFGNRWCCSRE